MVITNRSTVATHPNAIPTMFQVRAEREAVWAATISPLAYAESTCDHKHTVMLTLQRLSGFSILMRGNKEKLIPGCVAQRLNLKLYYYYWGSWSFPLVRGAIYSHRTICWSSGVENENATTIENCEVYSNVHAAWYTQSTLHKKTVNISCQANSVYIATCMAYMRATIPNSQQQQRSVKTERAT